MVHERYNDRRICNSKYPNATSSRSGRNLRALVLSSLMKGSTLNSAVKLTELKFKTLCYFCVKMRDADFRRLVTIQLHSRYRRRTDKQYIMTIAGHCNEIATFG